MNRFDVKIENDWNLICLAYHSFVRLMTQKLDVFQIKAILNLFNKNIFIATIDENIFR